MISTDTNHAWWSRLRHQGMLLSPVVMLDRFPEAPEPAPFPAIPRLRDAYTRFVSQSVDSADGVDLKESAILSWVDAVLQHYVGYEKHHLAKQGSIPENLTAAVRIGSKTETVRPDRVIFADDLGLMPAILVMADTSPHVGRGRGRTAYAKFLELLRGTGHRLGLLTNGYQFRLIYAGLDFESWCEWETERWFDDGDGSQELAGLRQLLSPISLKPVREKVSGLLDAVEESRKKQADLSSVLRENVRQAVEFLMEEISSAHRTDNQFLELLVITTTGQRLTDAETHEALMQAGVRIVMRMVVCLFAESRQLLPVNDPIYAQSYGVRTLYELLEEAVRMEGGTHALLNRTTAWPRLMSLFRLIHGGSAHGSFPLRAYGGALFRPGKTGDVDHVSRALDLFERYVPVSDATVFGLLRKLLRGLLPIVRGRTRTFVEGPVDYTDLRTEFIGLIYEGLLDYRLKRTDEAAGPQVFLNLGREPVLPLSRLEDMLQNDPKGLKDLLTILRKEKVTATASSDEGEEKETDEEADDVEQEDVEETAEPVIEATASAAELQTRDAVDAYNAAIAWAKQAIVLAGLVSKQGKKQPDSEYQAYLEADAKKLIAKVISVGEFYLVRAGNTRKGTGTFYTRPQLAVPTVHRTLEPLCYDKQPDGTLIPKNPKVILGLKVCDPACGSASMLVASLHYLTEALYRSLCHHCDLDDPTHAMKVTIPFGTPRSKPSDEIVPFPPNDPQRGDSFSDRVKAVLRRHVVERCIYGVDINPLAVELAQVSLWVETLDPELPFSFLDHKIKVGNALVGCWLDRVLDYPIKAWEREGGDGKDGTRTDRIESFLNGPRSSNGRRTGNGIIKQEMRQLIEQQFQGQAALFADRSVTVQEVVAAACTIYSFIHEIGVAKPDEREQAYREHFENNRPLTNLRHALDEWCAIWFWPTDEESLKHIPTPLTLHRSTPERDEIINQLRNAHKFFHWEAEFPDAFTPKQMGFDSVLGNPPWENAQPDLQEFFSDSDPLFRTYGRIESLKKMEWLCEAIPGLRDRWLSHCGFFKSFSNWVTNANDPFGINDDNASVFGRGGKPLTSAWRKHRSSRGTGGIIRRPFRFQTGRIFTYKLFLEVAHHLLTPTGILGLIVPSGLYTDSWSLPLRELFLTQSDWLWLFSFENRNKIFEIHRSFKFAVVVVAKQRLARPLNAAFMVHSLADWERLTPPTFEFDRALIPLFSPRSKAMPEVRTGRDLNVCRTIYQRSVRIGDPGTGWDASFHLEYMMNTTAKHFPPREKWEAKDFRPDEFGRWIGPDGEVAVALYEGRMIGQFDISQKGWVSGKGRSAVWRDIPFDAKTIEPQYLMSKSFYDSSSEPAHSVKLAFMDVTSATNARTMIAVANGDLPHGNSAAILSFPTNQTEKTLLLSSIVNSLCFDFIARQRAGGLHLNWFIVEECPLPEFHNLHSRHLSERHRMICNAASLTFLHRRYAPDWLRLKELFPELEMLPWKRCWAVTETDRLRLRTEIDALAAALFGLGVDDFEWIVRDDPTDPKGFFRVDRGLPFRERLTGLSAAAFRTLKDGKWSAESAAKLSNDEFFEIIGIPEMTSGKAAKALGLPEPLIYKRKGCHKWEPEKFTEDDPRYGWTWDDCKKDALALLGSEEAVQAYVEGKIDPPESGEVGGGSPSGNGGGSTDFFGNPVHEEPRQFRLF